MIVVVSGLHRCGTSMMMKMLVEGGIEGLYDAPKCTGDNPQGKFELIGRFQDDTTAMRDFDWVQTEGKAIKLPAPWIWYLPLNREFRVIYMYRDLESVYRSIIQLESKRDLKWSPSDLVQAIEMYRRWNLISYTTLSYRAGCRACGVSYENIVQNPRRYCEQIAEELIPEFNLDVERMIKVPDSKFWRNRPNRKGKV